MSVVAYYERIKVQRKWHEAHVPCREHSRTAKFQSWQTARRKNRKGDLSKTGGVIRLAAAPAK